MILLTLEEKRILLRMARQSIENLLLGKMFEVEQEVSEALRSPCGAFVTIKNKGRLRGCIGLITSGQPLYKTVQEIAVSAATKDTRFEPVTLQELEEVDLEISVLSPFKTISDISEIEVGKNGLFVIHSPFQGLLLPQVAVENKWDSQTFLEHTCLKAGLSPQAWKDQETIIQIFSAEVFGEEEL